jgi:hypothetical protein
LNAAKKERRSQNQSFRRRDVYQRIHYRDCILCIICLT